MTFFKNDGSAEKAYQTVPKDEEATLAANAFSWAEHVFSGWNTASGGTGTSYKNQASVKLTENLTLYAKWTLNSYKIIFADSDGTPLQIGDVAYGETPEYNGQTPDSGEAAEQYRYAFAGWEPEIEPVTGPAEYRAVYSRTDRTYSDPQWNWIGGDGTGYTASASFTTNDGAKEFTRTVEAVITEKTTAPTCTAAGKTVYTAKVTFGDKEYQNSVTAALEKLGHDYSETVTPPTCTQGGYATHICSRCGDSYIDSETAALGHDWGEWVITPATQTEDGSKTRTCSRCGETETIKIAATGHTYDLRDLNRDGKLDGNDGVLLFLNLAVDGGTYPLPEDNAELYDFNKDGALDIKDAVRLLFETGFPDGAEGYLIVGCCDKTGKMTRALLLKADGSVSSGTQDAVKEAASVKFFFTDKSFRPVSAAVTETVKQSSQGR